MGWGVARHKVYNLLLWITRQALEGENPIDAKPVSEVFYPEAATELIMASASAGAYHPMGSPRGQASRCRCSRQGHAWYSVRECIPGPHGMTNFHNPTFRIDTPV